MPYEKSKGCCIIVRTCHSTSPLLSSAPCVPPRYDTGEVLCGSCPVYSSSLLPRTQFWTQSKTLLLFVGAHKLGCIGNPHVEISLDHPYLKISLSFTEISFCFMHELPQSQCKFYLGTPPLLRLANCSDVSS